MSKLTERKNNIQQKITNQIISLLEKVNLEDYEPPFAGMAALGTPFNPTTQNHYQGVNILSLWFNQQNEGFSSNEWATFKQWKDHDARVKKGAKGSQIIFYKTLTKTEETEQGEEEEKKIPMLRVYTVFNATQVEGYKPKSDQLQKTDLVERIELIDEFTKNTGAEIRHDENRAYYNRDFDFINMPKTWDFRDTKYASATENYYSTLLHELTHWSGEPGRLHRDKAKTPHETEKIAFEELVAELGSAFLCAQHHIKQNHPEDHAIYIKSWLQALKNDPSHIFKAAAHSARAVDYLNNCEMKV